MATIFQVTRRLTGAAGAPATLRSGQIAHNNVDGYLYIGKGDNGSGVATSVVAFSHDAFSTSKLLPAGGATGQVLKKNSGSDYDIGWGDAGSIYTEGNGIDITGTVISVDAATIPSLDAGKIGSGTFNIARIPDLSAAKITSDTFDAARIPGLDASKLVSGTIDIARLPFLPGSQVIVSSGSIANLSAPQQAEIDEGSIVTTTDGRRWVYSGSGSKTAEASYVELADITPDWAVISGKPTFATVATSGAYADLTGRPTLATVATSGSYNDLTNKPTLGTMASQNANAVAITGGTIDGVVLDGGTF
jgi:hypothetical protein